MKFGLLGPVEVVTDRGSVAIAATRHKITLCLLLLDANRVVSVDRMIEALWGDRPPRTARSQVQIIISGLRQMLDENTIATSPPGYTIRIPDDALDLTLFERRRNAGMAAIAQGQHSEATRQLRSALDLWRGTAMEGMQSDVISAAATRLAELRISTLQKCIDLELYLGMHGSLIGELSEIVSEQPLNEGFRGQLMLALYRSGRQADALEIFRSGRDLLHEELGLDPSSELCRLKNAMMQRDPQIDLPGTSHPARLSIKAGAEVIPRQLPRTIADFTGRAEILAEISTIVSAAATSSSLEVPVIVLTGRGGTGKTTLAVRAGHMLSKSFPDGQLFLHLRPDLRQNQAGLLEHLLRSIGVPHQTIPAEADGRMAMYRSWLAGRRVLIVIDGADSIAQITPFLPGTRGSAVIVTSNQRFGGLDGAHQIEVGKLDDQSALLLLTRIIGAERMDSELQAAPELVRLCEGIPLALRIVAAKLVARRHWPIRRMVSRLQDETRLLDELDLNGVGVRATLAVAYESLDDGAARLLRRLSLLGETDFGFWVGAPLLGQEVDHADELLQKLVESYLVETSTVENGTIRFQLHNLVRLYAVERLAREDSTADRLAAMRRLLGCWLHIAIAAQRRVYGGDFAILHGQAAHWPLPAEILSALIQRPLEWFRSEHCSLVSAISHADRIELDELCWDLAMTATTISETGHYTTDWRDTHSIALHAVRRAGNVRGEAALLLSLGNLEIGIRAPEAGNYFEQALKIFNGIGDNPGRALALSGMAHVDRLEGNDDKALDYIVQSLDLLRTVGDRLCEGYMLMTMALIFADRREYDTAERLLDDALSVAGELKVARLNAQAQHFLAELQLRRGRVEPAINAFYGVLLLSRESDDIVGEAYALIGLGNARLRLGDLAGAETILSKALGLAERSGNRTIRRRSMLALAELDNAGARDNRAVVQADQAISAFQEHGQIGFWDARELGILGRIHKYADATIVAEDALLATAEMRRTAGPAHADRVAERLEQPRTDN